MENTRTVRGNLGKFLLHLDRPVLRYSFKPLGDETVDIFYGDLRIGNYNPAIYCGELFYHPPGAWHFEDAKVLFRRHSHWIAGGMIALFAAIVTTQQIWSK